MNSREALALAILRLNADCQQTPHIFPLDALQVEELRAVIVVLADLASAIEAMGELELAYWSERKI